MNNLVLPEWVVGFFGTLVMGVPALAVLLLAKKKIHYFIFAPPPVILGIYLSITYNVFALVPTAFVVAIMAIGWRANKFGKPQTT